MRKIDMSFANGKVFVVSQEALHSKNLAFNSAMVVEGKGYGVVVRIGDKTMIGSIAELAGASGGG